MKRFKKAFGKKPKKSIFLVTAVIIMAIAASMIMISCSTDKKAADEVDGATILQTNEDGETVVVATNKDGETVVYETDKSGNVKESKKSETKAAKATKAPATTAAATTAAPTTKATQAASVCYISVEGYCSGKAITLQGGDTAYSILTRSGASVSAENSSFGIYVKGINGRFASGSSGWLYSVNGIKPNYSAGGYGVSNGDQISWYWGNAY